MVKSVRIISKDSENNDKVIIVRKPNHGQLVEAQLYSAKIFNRAVEAGACLKVKLSDYLKKQNVWTDEDQEQVDELNKKIDEKVTMLKTAKKSDGTQLKLSEGRDTAIELRKLRFEYNLILMKFGEYTAYTVEGQAENARFDYLVSLCTFDENGNRVFINIDEYYEKQDEPYAILAATKLGGLHMGLDEEWQKKLPENEFLIKYKFVDNDLRYINKDGHFVDINGHLVDKDGFYINEQGEKIDDQGKLLTEPEIVEFIDDR